MTNMAQVAKICNRMEEKDGFRETTGERGFNTGPMILGSDLDFKFVKTYVGYKELSIKQQE